MVAYGNVHCVVKVAAPVFQFVVVAMVGSKALHIVFSGTIKDC